MLFTPPPFLGKARICSVSYLGNTYNEIDQQNHSFTSCTFGAEDPYRWIIVGICITDSASPPNFSSVTVGGVTATIFNTILDTDEGNQRLTFARAAVPTGTSGTIAVNLSATTDSGCSIGWWRALLSTATPTATASDPAYGASDDYSASLTIPTGGFGIGYSKSDGDGSDRLHAWTNLTENFDAPFSGSDQHSGAMSSTAGTLTRTVTLDGSILGGGLILAAWGL